MGTLKWGVICMLQARAHLDGQSRSVELAAIGRRVCETEHDLFLLLPGGRPDFPEPEAAPLEVPHDRPTAQELSEAVRSTWRGRGREHRRSGAISLSGRGQRPRHHRARAGAGARDGGPAHRARLDRLRFESDEELAAAIRSGALDERFDEVKRVVWQTVLDKLAVANPTYPS